MEQLGTVPSWENGGFMKKIGSQTIQFINTPTILETSSIVGPKESQGPLAS